MKSDYFNLEEGAHICTMNAGAMGYIVTQVAVRPEHRGKGIQAPRQGLRGC